jgi:ligand-binding sensor domain-containing protein
MHNNHISKTTIIVLKLILAVSIVPGICIMLPGININAEPISQHQDIIFDKLANSATLSNSPVYAIANDHYGYIWFGPRGGVYRYDGVDIISYGSISNGVVWAIGEDSQGTLWVGTNEGLNTYNYDTAQSITLRDSSSLRS